MLLHLVRHGETIWHHDNRYAGSSDIALTDLGLVQARHLANWAHEAQLDAIVTSDLSRSIITAQPSADICGLIPLEDSRLREVHFGLGEGMTGPEMRVAFEKDYLNFIEAPAEVPLPEGEAGTAAVQRGLDAIFELSNRFPEGKVLVVAHSTLCRLLICALTGIPLNHYRRVFPGLRNGAVTTLNIPRVPSSKALFESASLLEFNRPV